ncbi:MAG: hypothetical protein WD512_16185 [Candidatus Paceibacterota bacterium]
MVVEEEGAQVEAEIQKLEKIIEDTKKQVDDLKKKLPDLLQKEYLRKYKTHPWDIVTNYCQLVWEKKDGEYIRLSSISGHCFYIPQTSTIPSILYGKPGKHIQSTVSGSSTQGTLYLSDYQIEFKRIKNEYFKECLPTDQIIKAFKCFSIDIFISEYITTQHMKATN